MTPGRSFRVSKVLRDGFRVLAEVGDDVLNVLGGGPAAAELAAADPAGRHVAEHLAHSFGPGTFAITGAGIDADRLHHGCFELRVCLTHNTVSVVAPTEDCPLCEPTSAGNGPAEDSPAAVSDGPATTAPAAGHSDPLRAAATADQRVTHRLNRFRR